ncbi:MAG: MmgE/PrpD family protein [Deltaproteobacteria bacterium]|nr:MmgE/PrpD family protein [Deltaproteobacteria bacterium]
MTAREDVTTVLADWSAGLKFQDIPEKVIEEAKSQVMSVLGAVHAGAGTEAGAAVVKAVTAWGGGDESATMIPSGRRTSLHHAIYANAALSMALDYDDYLFAGHTGHSAVLASLAMAEARNLTGRDLLLSQVIANEVEGRVGASVLLGPQNGQLWTFIHLVGGAVAAGKMLGLDADGMRSALGIAMLQPPHGLWAPFFGSEAKILLASPTTVGGVQAAELAAAGLEGCGDVLESDQGFVAAFTDKPLMGAYRGLGVTWLTETLCFKIYPGCAYVDTAVDCVLELVGREAIDPAEVEAIEVNAGPLTLGMEALSLSHLRGPKSTPVTLNFSVPYNVAVALIDRELSPRQFTRARIADPAVWALAAKVQLGFDDNMTQRMQESSLVKIEDGPVGPRATLDLESADLAGFKMSFGSRVLVRLAGGRSMEAEVEVPAGGAGRPMAEKRAAVEEKFLREAGANVGPERASAALTLIRRLETLDAGEVRKLVGLTSG